MLGHGSPIMHYLYYQTVEICSDGNDLGPCWCSDNGNSATVHVWGARCSSVVRAFALGAMGRRIDPSWGEPIELFLVPASAPRLV